VSGMEQAAVISGIGMSAVGRRLHRDPWVLMADAAIEAIGDAGLDKADIDGVSTYPGPSWSTPGLTGGGVNDVRALLGLSLRWYAGGGETPGQLGSVVNAVLAVASGLARHVLCFRSVYESTAQDQLGGRASVLYEPGDDDAVQVAEEQRQWTAPYGIGFPCFGGMALQRYLHDSGGTREQVAQIPVVARANAEANPAAVYRSPLSVATTSRPGWCPTRCASTTATSRSTGRSRSSCRRRPAPPSIRPAASRSRPSARPRGSTRPPA